MGQSTVVGHTLLERALQQVCGAYPAEFASQVRDELREWLEKSEAGKPGDVTAPIRAGIVAEATELMESSLDDVVRIFNKGIVSRTFARYLFARLALAMAGEDLEQFRKNLTDFHAGIEG